MFFFIPVNIFKSAKGVLFKLFFISFLPTFNEILGFVYPRTKLNAFNANLIKSNRQKIVKLTRHVTAKNGT